MLSCAHGVNIMKCIKKKIITCKILKMLTLHKQYKQNKSIDFIENQTFVLSVCTC